MPTFVPPGETGPVKAFDPLVLDKTVIALPLLDEMRKEHEALVGAGLLPKDPRPAPGLVPTLREGFDTVIFLRPDYPGEAGAARGRVAALLEKAAQLPRVNATSQVLEAPSDIGLSRDHLFARLDRKVRREMLALDEQAALTTPPEPRAIAFIWPTLYELIIDLNLEYPGGQPKTRPSEGEYDAGRKGAREWVKDHIDLAKEQIGAADDDEQGVKLRKSETSQQYLFARLEARVLQKLVALDAENAQTAAKRESKRLGRTVDSTQYRAIFRVWPDFEVSGLITKSIATVKADAAQRAFSASGAGITWAVMDSGIHGDHPHFAKHENIAAVNPEWHRDFTVDTEQDERPLVDENGHGTHVAGIIAGEQLAEPQVSGATPDPGKLRAVVRYRQENGAIVMQGEPLTQISGMAPRCRLVSLKVLDRFGKGAVSNLIAAIAHIQELNGYGRRLLIHGVNMSLGYNFEPEWFACGQSPLCVEVDRLVKSGVTVVVAAGNTGYGSFKSTIGSTSAGMDVTINDPGNADLAITVGSTHRDMPHVYGVSYFSSKGPTGDGRLKPDLVAPGEKIVSCAARDSKLKTDGAGTEPCEYVETSGTSMAAPHVSGVIAAFLSVRNEFIGRPEKVKSIFVSSATDLNRDRYFQGAGLVDLMRAIQSV